MNRTLEELVRDTAPFPDSVIKTLDKAGGLDYVPWYQYAQRLLLHWGGYTWQVNDVMEAQGVWAVTGTLFLGEQPEDDSQSYSAVGEDSTPTAAESNAFKRACAHAGVGLHLYGDFWLHDRLLKEDPLSRL